MARSSQIRLQDFRAVFDAVGECCELWDDPQAWRRHAVASACSIVGSRTAHLIDCGIDAETHVVTPHLLAENGFEKEERGHLLASLKHPFGHVTPEADRLVSKLLSTGTVSAARPALVSSGEWQRFHGYQQFRRPARCDEFAISLRLTLQAGGPRMSLLCIDREPGERAATEREREMLSLLHAELQAREGSVLATENHVSRDGLSRRQRQTLEGLLDGLSEKQIARRLHLSVPTVHQYVTSLYRHFDVTSRGELMSHYIRRRPQPRTTEPARP